MRNGNFLSLAVKDKKKDRAAKLNVPANWKCFYLSQMRKDSSRIMCNTQRKNFNLLFFHIYTDIDENQKPSSGYHLRW